MNKFFASICIGFVALSFAKGMGIPIWASTPGDAGDIGVLSFFAAWLWPDRANAQNRAGDE